MILSWGILGSGLAAEDILFNRLGVQDGLSSNEITCILKDRKGFMWLGTTSGVNRFDGYEFKHYKYKESGLPFREEHVSELQETADGRIWITYNTNQLCVYEPGNDRFIPEKEILDSLRLENPPAKIFVDNDKQLYFATYTNEFCRYDQARGKIYSYPLNKEDGRVCDMSDVGDRLYVVHTSGVVEGIDKASGEPVYRDEYLTQYANAQLFYVFADSDGDLWFFLNPGYSRGLFRLNPKSKEWKHYTTETPVALSSIMVRDVAEDMNGNIWIATDHGGINILDKNKCRIYVPKGALAAYHTATWDWLGFPYILEEGDKYFDVDFELTGLTVKPFQPEIAISGRSVSFILVPDSGSFLPDSIEVWYPTGLEPCEYDAKTGKVTIATVKGNLTIKAKAIGALLPDKDTDITIGKDSTYTDGSTTGSKFNGVIGNDEELTRVKSLKIDTEDGKVTGITFKSLIVGSGSSTSQSVTIAETSNIEITLDGNNNLGKVLNQGSTRLLPGENTLLDALVENEGVFIDETGLLDAVTGPAGLTIAQRPEKAPRIEIGSSTLLKVEASAEGEANLSYIWEKFDSENNSWKQVKPEVQRTKALSSLRSDLLSTNEDTQLEVSEAGKYRCLVSNTVNAVNSTLTAYSEVSIASSTPDPTVTFSVTLPSVEGAALSPLAGTYSVEAGGSFSFSLTLDTDCDQSTPMVKVGDKLIEPTSDGKYEIKNINSDITISITGIVKNATVGNAEVESNALKIWGSNGVLHIQSAHVSTAYIMTFGGQLYKALTLPIGETMITIPQGAYIIRIENQSYKIRF